MKSKSLIFLLSGAFFAISFNACALSNKPYIEVKVPIKCDVPERKRPVKAQAINVYVKELLIYTELLEKDLNFCRKGQ